MTDRLGVEPIELPELPSHVHEWQPNGSVEVDRVVISPSHSWQDVLYTEVIALAVCRCGEIQRTSIGSRNQRTRGQDNARARR